MFRHEWYKIWHNRKLLGFLFALLALNAMYFRYRYEVAGEEKQARIFEAVVRDAVENPETFGISMYLNDYSEQEWKLLLNLCAKLNTCRNRERYSGAKLEQWLHR